MPNTKKNNNLINLYSVKIITAILFSSLIIIPSVSAENIRETPVVKAVKNVSPAVVNISSEYEVITQGSPFTPFGANPHFDYFFRDFFDQRRPRTSTRTSLGSGVIIDGKRGYILTNAHVIIKTGSIKITLKDERTFTAEVMGSDPDSDLAILKIDSDKKLPDIKMGDSNDLMIGETVIAIGNPFGFSNTVTTGVISALNRSINTDDRTFHNFIQTDASINPGNSGGPLLNITGNLIGINTAIYAKAQGIGFAIPINRAKRIVSDLIRYGEVVQAWTGITVQEIDAGLANYLGLKEVRGVLIKGVEKRSPASKKGFREGDIILSVNNNKISSITEYTEAIKNISAGDFLKIEYLRNNALKTQSIKTSVFPAELAPELTYSLLGIEVRDVRSRKGVVISGISANSYLAGIGARTGDLIRKIDNIETDNLESFNKAIIKFRNKKTIVILLQRGQQGYNITIEL